MENIGKEIETHIINRVREVLSQRKIPDSPGDLVQTDNLGEIIDKMVILHIRVWMLEDAVEKTKTDSEYAELRRKIDIAYKHKRPSFIEAINRLIDKAIIDGKSLAEDSIKFYKREEN